MVAYLLGLTEYLFGLAVLSTWSLRCSAKTQIGNPLLGTARLRLHVGQFIIPLPFATPTKTHVTLWKAWSMHVNSCGLIQHVSGAYLRVWLYRKTSPLYSIPNVLTVVFFNPKTIFLKKGGYATFPCYPWSTHVPWLEFKSSWLLCAKASSPPCIYNVALFYIVLQPWTSIFQFLWMKSRIQFENIFLFIPLPTTSIKNFPLSTCVVGMYVV